jgi:hypothetical protein
MPIDPNIPLMAGRGVTPLQGPLDAQARVQSLRSAMQQNELGRMKLDEAGRLQKQSEEGRQIFQEAGGDFR